jgi:hypothetical protein
MVRYAYEYELNNLLRIPEKNINTDENFRKVIIDYMEKRIAEIKKKHP